MNLHQTILVATDLSPYSNNVIQEAKVLAEKLDSTLYLFHVIESLPTVPPSFTSNEAQQKIAEKILNKLRKQGQQYEIREAQQGFEKGAVIHCILQKAKALQANMIILGGCRRTKKVTKLLGSTASAIINNTFYDVFIVYI